MSNGKEFHMTVQQHGYSEDCNIVLFEQSNITALLQHYDLNILGSDERGNQFTEPHELKG